MRPSSNHRALALLAAALLPLSCTMGPDYVEPEARVPETWSLERPKGVSSEADDLASWWTRLGDPALDRLMVRALDENHDLGIALARLREARARRVAVGAAGFPTIDASAAYSRVQGSEATELAQFGGAGAPIDLYDVGLDASWEIDFWGRLARSIEAADAETAAGVADVRSVLVSLAAEVATSYVDMQSFATRLAIARRNVAIQADTLELTRSRFESGLASELDTAQAERVLADTRSSIPPLLDGLARARNRLAVLIGSDAAEVEGLIDLERGVPVPPADVAVGVPADLLRRRPDIRRAERRLAAETARIGVAEAELYPRLTLFGGLGLQSATIDDTFGADALTTSYGAGVVWPLFDGGRLRAAVEVQNARQEQALETWIGTVRIAVEEAENALSAYGQEQERRAALWRAVEHARDSLRLSRDLYREGLEPFQTVLDAQRSLADVEDRLAASDAAVATDLIAIYRALGGGWEGIAFGPVPAP